MKALFKEGYGAGDFAVRIVPDPTPGPDEVVVRVHSAGICGTDLKIYQGHYSKYKPPVVLGHEFSGEIVAIGSNVTGLNSGNLVTARSTVSSCGKCPQCVTGFENICAERTRLGFDYDGAFAEYVKLRRDKVHLFPQDVDLTSAAMIEPVAVVVHALKFFAVRPSDVVLITGPGTIGLIGLMLCKASGARVAVSGLSKDSQRLALAKSLGADLILNVDEAGSEDSLLEFTRGAGADLVLECTGTEGGIIYGMAQCRRAGKFLQIGTRSTPMTIDYMKVAYKELLVKGCFGHMALDWEDAISVLGRLNLSRLYGKPYTLEQWNQAFEALESGSEVKVMFRP